MTGLYVISSKTRQGQLSQRRAGYAEHLVNGVYFYVREDHNSATLGQRRGERIQVLPQLVEDVRSVSADSTAACFFVEQKRRESREEALLRGLDLPLTGSAEMSLLVDGERRTARAWASVEVDTFVGPSTIRPTL